MHTRPSRAHITLTIRGLCKCLTHTLLHHAPCTLPTALYHLHPEQLPQRRPCCPHPLSPCARYLKYTLLCPPSARYLKYTPEHMHCIAVLFGPLAPPNTGVVAVQQLSNSLRGWRISGTGVVLELDADVRVVKKLKLTGSPSRVARHTAFIQGMFNSQL